MTRAGFDLSDRGVTGRAAPGALDVYAWTERGIYRAGETVHVAALARDGAANAVENLPLTFIFTRPDGVEDRRIVSDGAAAGGHAVDLAARRQCHARHLDGRDLHRPEGAGGRQPELPGRGLRARPHRVRHDQPTSSEIAVGEPANDHRRRPLPLWRAGRRPGARRRGRRCRPARSGTRFPGYFFGLADEQDGEATRMPLDDLPVVGDDGKATFPVSVDAAARRPRGCSTPTSRVRMREAGGRAVERSLDIGVRPHGRHDRHPAGIRRRRGAAGRHGEVHASSPSMPTASARRMPGALWTLVKIERNYQWYRNGNYWNYEPVTFTKRGRQRHDRHRRRRRGHASRSRSTGAATASRSRPPTPTARPPATSSTPAGMSRRPRPKRLTGSKSRSTRTTYAPGEIAKLQDLAALCRRAAGHVGAERLLDDRLGDRAGRRRDDRHSGRRRLGRRRLCHRHALPAGRGAGIAHAGARHRREMAEGRSRRSASSPCRSTRPRRPMPRQPLSIPVSVTGAAAGERRLCHGRGRRCRHPQPDQLRGAGSGRLVSSASACSASKCATSTAA